MAANLLQWFISTGARYAGTLGQEAYTRLFYPNDRDVQERIISAAFSANNNGKSLFTPAKKSSSNWQSYTLPAARCIEADAGPAAAALTAKCPPVFFQRVRAGFRADFYRDRPESGGNDYGDSRLRIWVDGLNDPELSDRAAACMLARIFAEIVFGMSAGGLRQGGGTVTAQLAEKAFGQNLEEIGSRGGCNIYMTGRRRLEAKPENNIVDRLTGASEVRMLNITAIGLIYGRERPDVIDPKRAIFENCLKNGTRFEIILPLPGSVGEQDAGTFKLLQGYYDHTGMEMIALTRQKVLEDMETMKKSGEGGNISLFFTQCALPYALMIVTYDNAPERDHIKVDLLSPYLVDDLERRSFFISRVEDPDNYAFFMNNYLAVLHKTVPYERFAGHEAAVSPEN